MKGTHLEFLEAKAEFGQAALELIEFKLKKGDVAEAKKICDRAVSSLQQVSENGGQGAAQIRQG